MVYLKTTITSCYGKVNLRELAVTNKIIVALFQLLESLFNLIKKNQWSQTTQNRNKT